MAFVSLALVDPSEQERDRLRRRVFQALREERARLESQMGS